MIERDPNNRWFGRGPRFRASAEVIRDQTLAVAGLLSPKMLGPSVRPPQPKLVMRTSEFAALDSAAATSATE